MSFLNPAGLWGLLGIPALILIYIIKPKFLEKKVTSTFIWKLSQKYQKKKLPWQITNLLLFVMQLLIITGISLGLARPVIITKDGAAEKIVIMDASASMLADTGSGSCFDRAKSELSDLADAMESYGKMSIILAETESRVLVERSGSEQDIKAMAETLSCSFGEADLPGAFALAEEMLKENPEAAVYLITDKAYENAGNVQVINVAEETAWNVAISSLEAKKAENRELYFETEITSYGMDMAAAVVLYVDDVLADAQLVSLLSDVPTTVEFTDLGIRQYESARVYVEAADALTLDNEFWTLAETKEVYDVLLVSEEPTFLETALLTFDNLRITVVASFDELDQGDQFMQDGSTIEEIPSTGYDLYVYDKVMPKSLPGDGAVWMICPEKVPKGVTFKLGDVVTGEAYLEAAPDSGTELFAEISREVDVHEVYVNEYLDISSALGFETLYTCNGAPVILAGEAENARAVLFAFDLSASNLPLRIAYPALVYNMVQYSLCPVLKDTSYEVGDVVTIHKGNGAVLTSVSSGQPGAVADTYVRMPVSFTAKEPGIYTVTQMRSDDSSKQARYFVGIPAGESNITAAGTMLPELGQTGTEVNYEKEITRWVVILLVVLILAEWLLQYREKFTLNKKLSLALRLVIVAILIALLADVKISREKDEINTIILADMSASATDSYGAVHTYINEFASMAGEKNRIGVVTFGKDFIYTAELKENGADVMSALAEGEAVPHVGATNLEEALYYAESLLNDRENQRIIILSDGIQTDGDALAAAKVMAERGVQVDAVCIPTRAVGFEMQVMSLSHPQSLSMGEETELKVVVQSNHDASAELRFMDNGAVISKRIVDIKEGLSEFTSEYTPSSLGIHEISVRLVPVQDSAKENNTYYSWLEVAGKGNILLVDGTGREAAGLKYMLSEEYSVTEIEPEEAEGYMNQLAAYQGVILMNVSNADLPEGFDKALETYVEKYGGGLLTTGGSNTYAYGSMTDTAFEDLLPVTLELGKERVVAMMLVVDTSSSMQGLNHRMAIQGTMQCIEALEEKDYVGVLTFDRTAHVIYDLASMEQKDDILEAVEAIELGRGTYMTDATREAYNQLKDFEADKKHVIILSDGEPQDSGYIRVVKQMAANGITVSAIAVGQGADRRIMETIAQNGNGNYYYAVTVKDLPDIMVDEVVSATDSYRHTGTFPISVASYSTLLGDLDANNLPTMSGYTTTFLKKGAEQFLTVADGEPLYVQWDYGSGRVGSFTADLRGNDSEQLFASEDGIQLIKNMVSGLIRTDGKVTALGLELTPGNQTAGVEISAALSGKESLQVSVLSPDGSEETVETVLTTKGTYRGTFATDSSGVYTVTATHLGADGKLLDFAQANMASSYSKEYKCFGETTGEELLLSVCEATGGKMAYTAANVMEFTGKLMKQMLDPAVPLLIVLMVIVLAEIAIRKFRLRRRR